MAGFKIAIIGEARGQGEEYAKAAFIGASGQELTRMLTDAGITRGHCFLTNVFNFHPPQNNVEFFLCGKKEASSLIKPSLTPSKYLSPAYESEVLRLYAELEELRPNLAILLGNTACWAMLYETRIAKIRGAITTSKALPWLKCLPTYHPAAVLRQYDLRHVTVLDLMKAREEAEFPEVRRVERTIWLDPTLDEIEEFYEKYVPSSKMMAFDIETDYGKQITCISFAPAKDVSIVIPFFDYRKPSGSYWTSLQEELSAWALVRKFLSSPCRKVGQNALFDMQFLWQIYGIPVINAGDDSMLIHHSLHPESPKGLDFLGSVYANEVAWKTERPKGRKKDVLKRND